MSEQRGDWMRGISPPRGRPTSVSESRMSVMDRIAEISRLLELKTGASASKVKGNPLKSFFKENKQDPSWQHQPREHPPAPQPPPVAMLPSVSASPAEPLTSVSMSYGIVDVQSPYQPAVQQVIGYDNPSYPIIQNYGHPAAVNIEQPIPIPVVTSSSPVGLPPGPLAGLPPGPLAGLPPGPPVGLPAGGGSGGGGSAVGMISLHNPYGQPASVEIINNSILSNGRQHQQPVDQVESPPSPLKSESQTSPPKSDMGMQSEASGSPKSQSPKSIVSNGEKPKVISSPTAVTNLSNDLQEKLKLLSSTDNASHVLQVCQNCDTRSTAVFCVQCDSLLCNECATQIHSNKLFKNHVVSNIPQKNIKIDSQTLNNMFVPPIEVQTEGETESSSCGDTPKLLSATAEKLRELEEVSPVSNQEVKQLSPVPELLRPLDEVLESMFITINDMRQRAESPRPESPQLSISPKVVLTNNSFDRSTVSTAPPDPLPQLKPKPVPAPAVEPQAPAFPSDISQVFMQLATIVEQFTHSPSDVTPRDKKYV